MRVGVTDFRWPLDPARVTGRDETTIARTLFATPLRTDPRTAAIAPGLCSAWRAGAGFREWRFTCRAAPSIAAALRRVARMPDSPSRWLFAAATRISASRTTVLVRLPFAWRRFPYALSAVAAAPRFVPGPFRLVRGSRNRIVVRRPGLTIVFQRLGARVAAAAFRRGALDEAPVPLGDLGALRADSALRKALHVRRLLALDLVGFRLPGRSELRRTYWETANRGDYEALVAERAAPSSFELVGGEQGPDPARFRRAVKRIPSLPRVRVRIAVPADPILRYGADVLYGQWREAGLGPRLVSESSKAEAWLRRAVAAYPQEEAIPADLLLGGSLDPAPGRGELVRSLGESRQRGTLERVDEQLGAAAAVIPVAWVADARLVSPRLRGWREDVLGDVDYEAVTTAAQ